MKIGIVTYIKDDNYGEELQAFAMQHYLNSQGWDAEVIDLEKRVKDLSKSKDAIIPAIVNRFKIYGWKAPYFILKKFVDIWKKKKHDNNNKEYRKQFHLLFEDFFNKYTKHSTKYYTLDEIRITQELPYDTYIAGSDQIWNYMHTDFLDVFFLEFAKKYKAKRISYAASISVPKISEEMRDVYKSLVDNIEYLSIRELQGAKLLFEISNRKAEVVLDPTFLLNKKEWMETVGKKTITNENYVLVYTLSGSKYIKTLAKVIAKELECKKIIFIISNETFIYENDIETQILIGPCEWVGLMSEAKYVVTDSFHGTAFSINFNCPFTTLVNPVSNMNTRVTSILEITNLQNRIYNDDGKNRRPESLNIDYSIVNHTIEEWRSKSKIFLSRALS